jgi:transcriptional regulator with XRE-family HTH domain
MRSDRQTRVANDEVVLRDFLRWMLQEESGLSQIDVARQARVSQSVIQKYVSGTTFRKYGDLATYQKVTAAYPRQWSAYLHRHPHALQQIRRDFAWVLAAVGSTRSDGVEDPEMELALGYLHTILASAHGGFALQTLKAMTDFVSYDLTPNPPAPVTGSAPRS